MELLIATALRSKGKYVLPVFTRPVFFYQSAIRFPQMHTKRAANYRKAIGLYTGYSYKMIVPYHSK
jgi:hypothetical protein